MKINPAPDTDPHFSISRYYKPETTIGHIYPQGEKSFHFNCADELNPLYAGRIATSMSPTDNSHAVVLPETDLDTLESLNIVMASRDRITVLDINPSISRTKAISDELKRRVKPGTLVLAQPFKDSDMDDWLLIKQAVTDILIDKGEFKKILKDLPELIPTTYHLFENGEDFRAYKDYRKIPLPCVVKATKSGGGEAVFKIMNQYELELAQSSLALTASPILIEEFLEGTPISVQFGITPTGQIDFLGYNNQFTDDKMSNQGGIQLYAPQIPPEVIEKLKATILTRAVQLRWFGVCSIGGLITDQGIKFFDPNFRPSASMSNVIQKHRGVYGQLSQAIFFGTIYGEITCVRRRIQQLATIGDPSQILHVNSFAKSIHRPNEYNIHAAILFDDSQSLQENAQRACNSLQIKSFGLDACKNGQAFKLSGITK